MKVSVHACAPTSGQDLMDVDVQHTRCFHSDNINQTTKVQM